MTAMTSNSDQTRPMKELYPLDDRPGPAWFSSEQSAAMVEDALNAWEAERVASPWRRPRRMALVAVAVFSMTSAAAALWYGTQIREQAGPSRPPATPKAVLHKHVPAAPQPTPTEIEPSAPTPLEETEAPARRFTPKTPAEDLLQRANKLRGAGKWRAAESTYRQVFVRYPGSMSAYVARVAAASIQLEHLGNPRAALRHYQRALVSNPAGSLDLETRQGIAQAWRQLGDRQREIHALKALLQRHTSGPAVKRARRRLEAIASEQ